MSATIACASAARPRPRSRFCARRRVELNALSTAQLVELVETAFAEHGVEKVIPDADDLVAAWRSAKAHAEIAEAVAKANAARRSAGRRRGRHDLADRYATSSSGARC